MSPIVSDKTLEEHFQIYPESKLALLSKNFFIKKKNIYIILVFYLKKIYTKL